MKHFAFFFQKLELCGVFEFVVFHLPSITDRDTGVAEGAFLDCFARTPKYPATQMILAPTGVSSLSA
jgi:hypothetical protein